MARIMLVNPPWYVFLGSSSSSMPLGLTSLAGVLKAAGHSVSIFNADLLGHLYASDLDVLKGQADYEHRLIDEDDPVWRLVRDRIAAWAPDVVGVHVKTPLWMSGCRVAQIAKEILPSVVTIAGGPHVSCMPQDVVDGNSFDCGVMGEGERAMLRLVDGSDRRQSEEYPA